MAPALGKVTTHVRGVVGVPTTTALDFVEAPPVPSRLVARTVNRYDVRFVNPVTVHDRPPVVAHVRPPGDAVTTYFVIVAPPLLAGAFHETTAARLRELATTVRGAPGLVGVSDAPTRRGTHDTSGFGSVLTLPAS